jgi:hypothetical protein
LSPGKTPKCQVIKSEEKHPTPENYQTELEMLKHAIKKKVADVEENTDVIE